MSTHKFFTPPVFCFLVALALRLGTVLTMGGGMVPDSYVYVNPALGISGGHGFWYFHHNIWTNLYVAEPGYSFFLATWFFLGVPVAKGILVVQAVLGALLSPVVYSYVLRRAAPSVALASAMIYALDPVAAGPCSFILRELFVMAIVMAAVSAMDIAGRLGVLFRGSLLGLGSLSFPVLGLWSIWLWVQDRWQSVDRRRVTWVVVLIAFAVSGSWVIRNMFLSKGNFAFRRHSTSVLLYYTAHYDFPWLPDTSEPVFKKIVDEAETKFGYYGTINQRDMEIRILRETWNTFAEHPLTVTGRFLKANFWFWTEVPGAMGLVRSRPMIHTVLISFHAVQMILFFAGIGFAFVRRELGAYRYVWGSLAYVAVFIFPFMPIPRYYTAFLPLIDIMAGYGLVCIWQAARSLRVAAPAR